MNILKDRFERVGFFYEDNFINADELEILKKSIDNLVGSKKGVFYADRNGSPRRMEEFTFLDPFIKEINVRIISYLHKRIGGSYLLFKDKINFKPSGGEGFDAHYDGVFQFKKSNGKTYNGWYEYTEIFINVLIALDDFTSDNGALEISSSHEGNFNALLNNTKKNGTPDLTENAENSCFFETLHIEKGGVAVFKNTCPHRSGPNYSSSQRSSLYFTYTPESIGSLYDKYFQDKSESTNPLKALSGKLV